MILLDTHVVLWLAFEPKKISRKANLRIEQARKANEGLAISGITLLEIATAARKGKFKVAMTIGEFLEYVEAMFTVLSITSRSSSRTWELPADYPRDPADRIIGATALVEGLTLITADRNILASKAVESLW
jgi:PIN domain nuclease of toxin-antitoxin system